MQINWFPGHMKKTLDAIQKDAKNVDIILYVLDARAPISCLNPKIDDIVKNKTVLYIINKADLISKQDQNNIVKLFTNNNKNVLVLQGTNSNSRAVLFAKLKELSNEKLEKAKQKGFEPIFKVMVIGTPNTGKSTIINTLCGQKKTITGDKAGVTKNNQWVKINDNFALLDTPGTLWPKFDNPSIALKLAFIGSIKKEVLEETEIGFELVKYLIKNYPNLVTKRYGVVNFERETIEIYDDILKRLGCIMKGGDVDYERGAVKILEDFRSGRIGQICLDKFD